MVCRVGRARGEPRHVGVLTTLATGSTILAISEWTGAGAWIDVGAWLLVVPAGIAWCTATAMMLETSFGRVVLPLGKHGRAANVPGGRITEPVEYRHGMPGAREGR